ncbi:Gfo/Idh/MocA family oxidoreductase [bacterium]|nr:MAG: Gfo/Idh/MocA family oxidoreductase [bacterium]
MTTNKQIRWGILGLGKIAHKFAQDLLLSEHAVLYAVASRSQEKAVDFGTQYQAKACYSSYEAMLEDPNVDVVYIATPHVNHFEWTLKSLQMGKHVLCEKPMGMNAKQVELVKAEAEKRNLFLMEGIWTRFIPMTEKLLQLLNENLLGKLISIRADFGFKAPFDLNKRIYNKSLGGGSLLDIGIYPIYLSLLLFGKPKTVQASARFTSTQVDATCMMMFGYDAGQKAMLESTIETTTPTEAYIFGTEGSIHLHPRFHHTEKITLNLNGQEQFFEEKYLGNGYIHEIDEVNQCLFNGKTESEKLPMQTSLDLASILDEVRAEIGLEYS